ncbi:D-2-hydroxyacid dehydrogenase [Faecalimonas sp.]
MKIIFLDAKTLGDDVDLSNFEQFGEVVRYDYSSPTKIPDRVKDADVIIVNKVSITESTIHTANKLKLVCVTATGTDNLDKKYLEANNITWRNVAGYSTNSVAQHTFALLFYLLEKLDYYDTYVKNGDYSNNKIFTHLEEKFAEIEGKTWGIIGLGNIGRRVAQIADCFGAKIIYYSPSTNPTQEKYTKVDFDTLLTQSDIISVHAPLTEETRNLIDKSAFSKMKPSSIFLNLGRGAIVVEKDLAYALENNLISAAGLDVLCTEPIEDSNPLLKIKDSRKLFITPHIAWASIEARTKLMNIVLEQIKEFFRQ